MKFGKLVASAIASIFLINGAAVSGPISAQTLRPTLDYDTAATIRDGCIAFAQERNLQVSIAVFDDAGRLITSAHLDGTASAIQDVAQWKGKSAATYRFPSAATANWGGPAPGMSNWGGGVPFGMDEQTPLGGIGVSGAQTDEDIACGMAGIAAAGLVALNS